MPAIISTRSKIPSQLNREMARVFLGVPTAVIARRFGEEARPGVGRPLGRPLCSLVVMAPQKLMSFHRTRTHQRVAKGRLFDDDTGFPRPDRRGQYGLCHDVSSHSRTCGQASSMTEAFMPEKHSSQRKSASIIAHRLCLRDALLPT